MGRLIDADALIEKSKKFLMDRALIEIFETLIDDTPTAYDIEKVVAELEKNGQKMSETKGNPWDSSDHKYYKAISVKKAIEIVKRGGAE